MSAADATQLLNNLKEYASYYRKESERIAKSQGPKALESTYITYPEMSQILTDIHAIFKTAFGVGLRKNAAGQAFPEKRAWEVR